MIVSGVLNKGANGAGADTENRAETVELRAPPFLRKSCKKSREIYDFTAFCGGPNRDRTDDLTDANRTLSQLSYRPIFGCFIYFRSICLCSLLF